MAKTKAYQVPLVASCLNCSHYMVCSYHSRASSGLSGNQLKNEHGQPQPRPAVWEAVASNCKYYKHEDD